MKIRLTLLLTFFCFFAYSQEPDLQPNLSVNGVISAFSAAESDRPAYNVINGIDYCDLDLWTSLTGFPQFIEIDLGADKYIQASKLSSYANRIYKYKIEAKESNGTYSTVVDKTNNTAVFVNDFWSKKARFVKLTITGAHIYTGNAVSIREFSIYGKSLESAGILSGVQEVNLPKPDTIITTLFKSTVSGGLWSSSDTSTAKVNALTGEVTCVALGGATIFYTILANNERLAATATRTVTVTDSTLGPNLAINGSISSFSSTSSPSTRPPTNVIDDINADDNLWTSSMGFPQFIEVDLGADKNIAASKVSSYANRIYKYKIEARESNGTYTTVVDKTNNTLNPMTDLWSTTARYVKLTITGTPTTSTVASIREFYIFGKSLGNAGTLSGTQQISLPGGITTFSSTVTGGTWSSSHPSIATVNATTGKVTGVALGEATISYIVKGTYTTTSDTATRKVYVELDPNLAIQGTISSFSSTSSPSTRPATNAIDSLDNDTNLWTSLTGFPQYIEVDLGTDKNISASRVSSYANRVYKYKIEARESNGTYTTVVDKTNNTTVHVNDFWSKTARYVKLTITGTPTTSTVASIREFYIFGKSLGNAGTLSGTQQIAVLKVDSQDITSKLYPNPVKDKITLTFNSARQELGRFQIVDLYGKVKHFQNKAVVSGINQIEFNVSELASGIYLIKWGNNVKKFIKLN